MGTEVESLKSLPGGWSVVARRCDSCKTAAAAAFCRADSAFLCLSCDMKIHGTNKVVSRHERVWMCEVCEQAPAAVTCKADAAVLCISCDSDIHSANPLARRHERVPIEPFFDSADSIVKSSSFNFLVPNECEADSAAAGGFHHHNHHHHNQIVDEDDVNGVSWLLPTPNPANLNSKISMENTEMKTGGGDLFNFTEIDPFLDIHEFQQNHSTAADRVVPVQTKPLLQPPVPLVPNKNCYDIDFCRSKLSSFNYPCQSISQSVSSSSLDVGVVPDGNSLSDISYPFVRNTSNSDPSGPISAGKANQAAQICGIDREARVLRYREKRKNRKFEKTIRYASRKAYAETRPRIKGRFAKRTEIESDMNRLYNSAAYMADVQYGVVPSFGQKMDGWCLIIN